jgi:poly-beta-1,6-N-acetyl-D-glucosamine N-deacetylase
MILMYHNIGPTSGFNTISLADFARQMQFLIENGFAPLSLDRYIEKVKMGGLNEQSLALTFDDGYTGFAENAMPVLERLKIPAAVFIPTAYVGKYNEWDQGKTQCFSDILSWEGLKRISQNPQITLGSHGVSHKSMGAQTWEETLFEMNESKNILQSRLGIEVRYFSFPYGQKKDVSPQAVRAAEASGYDAAFSTNWNRHNSAGNLFRLNRLEIEPLDDVGRFEKKLKRPYHLRFFKQKIKNILSLFL